MRLENKNSFVMIESKFDIELKNKEERFMLQARSRYLARSS